VNGDLKLFIARYYFECPLCSKINTDALMIFAANAGDARDRFDHRVLRCDFCPGKIVSREVLFIQITEEAKAS